MRHDSCGHPVDPDSVCCPVCLGEVSEADAERDYKPWCLIKLPGNSVLQVVFGPWKKRLEVHPSGGGEVLEILYSFPEDLEGGE